jgi:hypothetical protein
LGAHLTIHWRPDASFKARETILRLASEMKWRMVKSGVAVVSCLAKAPKQRWVTKDAAKSCSHRNLLEDNPTSG